jgi:hypothetical protein
MTLPKNNPLAFCKAFISRELEENKASNIWMTYWPVMERLIARAEELTIVFDEIVEKFGYSDRDEGYPPNNSYVWLILEHIWVSSDYCKADVVNARADLQELKKLQKEIVEQSSKLADSLRKQNEFYESSGFHRQDYQSVTDMIDLASESNGLHKSHLSPKLKALSTQYDLKYWPSRAGVIQAIADYEKKQPLPKHEQLPDTVIKGRASDIKDFVLAFDRKFDDMNGLPSGFKFTNKAMAEIINVVLDLQPDKLVTPDAIKTVRGRYNLADYV